MLMRASVLSLGLRVGGWWLVWEIFKKIIGNWLEW